MNRFKMKRPYYISFIAMIVFIGAYLYLQHVNPYSASDIVITILTIVAGVAFWLEYHHNSKVNEAQFVMELNNQFVTDEKMAMVEHKLEQYYSLVKNHADEKTISKEKENLKIYFDIDKKERQDLVNYLVHLEGVATLVNTGVLKIKTISNLMAYRFFIAVNNPVVQDLELDEYREFYKGIEELYDKWYDKVNPMPLSESAWEKEKLSKNK